MGPSSYKDKSQQELELVISMLGDVASPLGLLEELFPENPWQLFISTIFLNRTTRVQVDPVLFEFLEKWPSPVSILNAQTEEIAKVIRPLGMHHKRASGVIKFTKDYLSCVWKKEKIHGKKAPFVLNRDDVMSMYQCGEYAYSAYRLFIQRSTSDIRSNDHALVAYAEYQKGRCEREKNSPEALVVSSGPAS